jgi:hypothetical protein
LTSAGLRLNVPSAATYRVAVRYSPYWQAANACVRPSADGMTLLTVTHPGIVDLDLSLTLGSALRALAGATPSCAR